MAAFHLGEPVPGCGIVRYHSLKWLTGNINGIKLSFMLFTVVPFLVEQVKMSAVKRVFLINRSHTVHVINAVLISETCTAKRISQ